jgi:hypothetical protein
METLARRSLCACVGILRCLQGVVAIGTLLLRYYMNIKCGEEESKRSKKEKCLIYSKNFNAFVVDHAFRLCDAG